MSLSLSTQHSDRPSPFHATDLVGTPFTPESESTARDPHVAGWVGFFRRKKASKGDSDFPSSSPLNPGPDVSDIDTLGAQGAYSASSMDEDSLGENLVGIALAKSTPSKLAETIESTEGKARHYFETQLIDNAEKQQYLIEPILDPTIKQEVASGADGEELDFPIQTPGVADKKSSLVESIQKISSELENQTRSSPSTPALAISTTEAELTKLIDSKDWKALADFSLREEGLLEQELESLQSRFMKLEPEAKTEAQMRAQREFESTMTAIRSKEHKEDSVTTAKGDDPVA